MKENVYLLDLDEMILHHKMNYLSEYYFLDTKADLIKTIDGY